MGLRVARDERKGPSRSVLGAEPTRRTRRLCCGRAQTPTNQPRYKSQSPRPPSCSFTSSSSRLTMSSSSLDTSRPRPKSTRLFSFKRPFSKPKTEPYPLILVGLRAPFPTLFLSNLQMRTPISLASLTYRGQVQSHQAMSRSVWACISRAHPISPLTSRTCTLLPRSRGCNAPYRRPPPPLRCSMSVGCAPHRRTYISPPIPVPTLVLPLPHALPPAPIYLSHLRRRAQRLKRPAKIR